MGLAPTGENGSEGRGGGGVNSARTDLANTARVHDGDILFDVDVGVSLALDIDAMDRSHS